MHGFEDLIIGKQFSLCNGTVLVGFSRWTDGGEASNGSIHYLIEFFKATQSNLQVFIKQ